MRQYCNTNLVLGLRVFNYSVVGEETEIQTQEKIAPKSFHIAYLPVSFWPFSAYDQDE